MDDASFAHRARKRIREAKKKARPGKRENLNLKFYGNFKVLLNN